MELSIFLAKFFGIYLLIVAGLWAVRGAVISKVMKEMMESGPLLFVSGLLALAVGIALAISHSVWEPSWRIVITLLGYLSIVKGIIRIAFPEAAKKAVVSLMQNSGILIWIVLAMLLGGYLTWVGFTVT